jgi:hypothetical protein
MSFLGKLLVLPANVRLDRKVIARYKQSSLFCLVICNEGKKFYNLETREDFADKGMCYKQTGNMHVVYSR